MLYRALTGMSEPFAGLALRLKARDESPELWAERLGRGTVAAGAHWWHAASMGEVAALEPVLRVHRSRGGGPFAVTTTTTTGRERASRLWGACVSLAPLDFPRAVRRVLDARRPRSLITVETEVWPNLWREAFRREVPVAMVNARISDRTLPRYRQGRGLFGPLFARVRAAAARTERDAERLVALGVGAAAVRITGNTKHDLLPEGGAPPAPLPWKEGPVWVAGSVHPGEAGALVRTHQALARRIPGLRWVVAPRHLDRVGWWLDRLAPLDPVRRSRPGPRDAAARVLLLDTHGELPGVLAAAHAAFIGGTLVPLGGHNPLEASAAGVPVAGGPYIGNAREDWEALHAVGAGVSVPGESALVDALQPWLADPVARTEAGEGARRAVTALRGASAATFAWLLERGVVTAGCEKDSTP